MMCLMKRTSPWGLFLPLSLFIIPLFVGFFGLLLCSRRGFPLQCFAKVYGQQCYKSWLCSWLLTAVTVFVLVPWFVAGCDSSCDGHGSIDSFLPTPAHTCNLTFPVINPWTSSHGFWPRLSLVLLSLLALSLGYWSRPLCEPSGSGVCYWRVWFLLGRLYLFWLSVVHRPGILIFVLQMKRVWQMPTMSIAMVVSTWVSTVFR